MSRAAQRAACYWVATLAIGVAVGLATFADQQPLTWGQIAGLIVALGALATAERVAGKLEDEGETP